MQVDVGFGDTVVPDPTWIEFPTLLDFPAPRLLAYPPESSVAEKFGTMVELDAANTRMKDFFDIWTLARRRTPLPSAAPLALTAEFADDRAKQTWWRAFVSRGRLDLGEQKLGEVISFLRDFLMPPTVAAASRGPFESFWPAGGPWQAPPRGRR